MGPTGSASAILFCCICVVALSSSFMAIVAAAPEKTAAVAESTVPEKPTAVATSVVPEKTTAVAASAVPEETTAVAASTVPEKAPKFISMGALECSDNVTKAAPSPSTARKLIGVHHARGNAAAAADGVEVPGPVCPVRFDHMSGVRVVVGSCRDRPVFSPERCCGALKTFACPYSDLINDLNSGCANDMFFQIIVRGRLPRGLFSHICVEGPLGLTC